MNVKKNILNLIILPVVSLFNSRFAKSIKLGYVSDLAKKGDPKAQHELAHIYVEGKIIAQDYQKAFKWCSSAAMKGDSDAQNDLGTMYENGQGTAQDYSKALKWYQKAADQGNTIAKINM